MRRCRIVSLLGVILCFLLGFSATKKQVSFASTNELISEEEISQSIDKQLGDLDFSELDKIIAGFSDSEKLFFQDSNFIDKISKLLSGDFEEQESIFVSIVTILFDQLLQILPFVSIIVAISLIGDIVQGLKPSSNKSISNIIHFLSYGVVVSLVLVIIVKMISVATSTITALQTQMNGIFPILLTLLTAVGGTTSVSLYQPAMALLANTILNLFNYLLLPIFIFSVVFSIISNLSNTVKLDKFSSFFNSCFKWIVGLVFTIFTAFVSLQGITAGTIDGISIRTAKYAIRSYVPLIGGYIGDGMGLILASSSLIKNAVGVGGLLMTGAAILSPLIQMILFMLALKLIAAIVQPLGNKQVANLLGSLSKNMVLLIVLLVGVAFVYFILLGLVMCSANVF